MTDFVYDGTSLPTGKSDNRPSPGPSNQYLVASEWNTAMQASLDLRAALLSGQYHGAQSVYWKDLSGATQARSWYTTGPSRHVLSGDATGTTPWVYVTTLDGMLHAASSLAVSGTIAATDTITGSNLSGTNTGDQTITLTGDVTGSGMASFATTIANSAVTLAKMANITRFTLLGKHSPSPSSGPPEEVSLNGTLQFTGSSISLADLTENTLLGRTGGAGTGLPTAITVGDGLSSSGGTLTAPIRTSLYNTNGSLSTDIAITTGTSLADASVHGSAKLLSVGTGITGTYVEYMSIQKTLGLVVGSSQVQPGGIGYFPTATYSNQFRPSSANTFSTLVDSWAGAMTGASDTAVRIGTTTANGSVNASATILSIGTGIGGTYVESLDVRKGGVIYDSSNQASLTLNSTAAAKLDWAGVMSLTVNSLGSMSEGYGMLYHRSLYTDAAARYGLVINTLNAWTNADAWLARFSSADVAKFTIHASGRVDQIGTDSSGTPGAATINKPSGISSIASGASSVTITNSLATTTSKILITWLDDTGAARSWVTRAAGSFTVNLSAASSADAAFAWEVSYLL